VLLLIINKTTDLSRNIIPSREKDCITDKCGVLSLTCTIGQYKMKEYEIWSCAAKEGEVSFIEYTIQVTLIPGV
jgi:hypothetical protein